MIHLALPFTGSLLATNTSRSNSPSRSIVSTAKPHLPAMNLDRRVYVVVLVMPCTLTMDQSDDAPFLESGGELAISKQDHAVRIARLVSPLSDERIIDGCIIQTFRYLLAGVTDPSVIHQVNLAE